MFSCQGLWYCLTRYVPGAAIADEDAGQRSRRGRDLARLHVALRGLGGRMGQRPGWRAQHTSVTVHASIDWAACLRGQVGRTTGHYDLAMIERQLARTGTAAP